MMVKVRFPDGVREIEVTQWRSLGGRAPDVQAMFPTYIVLETLGPDEDGCFYTAVRRTSEVR